MIHFIQHHWWLWLILWIVGWTLTFLYRTKQARLAEAGKNDGSGFGLIFCLAGIGTFSLVLLVISCFLLISHHR